MSRKVLLTRKENDHPYLLSIQCIPLMVILLSVSLSAILQPRRLYFLSESNDLYPYVNKTLFTLENVGNSISKYSNCGMMDQMEVAFVAYHPRV